MMIKRTVLFILFCAAIFSGLAGTFSFDRIMDLPSLAIVVLSPLFLLLFSYKWSEIGGSLSALFGEKKEIGQRKASILENLCDTSGDLFLLNGVIGTVTGFVIMLVILDDFSGVGEMLSVAMISCFYGLILWIAAFLLGKKISLNKAGDESNEIYPSRGSFPFIVALVLFAIVQILIITMADPAGFIYMVDTASLVILIGGTVIGAYLFNPADVVNRTLKLSFSKDKFQPDDYKMGLKVYSQISDLIAGIVVFASVAAVLAMISDYPVASELGPKAAVALLSIYYGCIILSLIRVLKSSIERKLIIIGQATKTVSRLGVKFVFCYSLVISALVWTILFCCIYQGPEM